MAQFTNSREKLVMEAIDGAVAASGGGLARLAGYPHIRVVVRNPWDKSRVALVSGGGSGHEPAHAGFVVMCLRHRASMRCWPESLR